MTHVFSISTCFHPNNPERVDHAQPVSTTDLRQWNTRDKSNFNVKNSSLEEITVSLAREYLTLECDVSAADTIYIQVFLSTYVIEGKALALISVEVPFKFFRAGYQDPYFQMKTLSTSEKVMLIITDISRVPAILHRATLSPHNYSL